MFGISYWVLPAFAGTVWLGTLAALLGWWIHVGSPHYSYVNPHQHIAFISDIAAQELKPLFIAGSATCVVVFDLALISERWLRHRGRLAHNYNKKEEILSVCSIIAAIVGAAGLILLSIFDVAHYHHFHDAMLGVFIVGYIISAIFICAEYQRLGIHFREYRHLRMSFWIKLFFILLEIALVIAYGVLLYENHPNPAAVLEWVISLVFIFYVWSFVIDFIPAVGTRPHDNRFPVVMRTNDPESEMTQARGNADGGPVYTSGGWESGDSQQPIVTPEHSSRNF